MKKTITKNVNLCDNCNKESYPQKCLGCRVEHCWDCAKTLGIEYKHAVHFSGSGDGYFCFKCNDNPPKAVQNIYSAYKKIESLRRESDSFWGDFNNRSKQAEAELKALLK